MSGFSSQPIPCAVAEEQLMLRLYDELSPEEASVLDAHLANCENCRRELTALRALEETLAAAPPIDPPQQLLEQTRATLAASLDRAASHKPGLRGAFSSRFFQPVFGSLQGFRAAPLAVAAMLLAGVGIGGFGGYQMGVKNHPVAATATTNVLLPVASSPIASVSSVSPESNSNTVVVRYNRLVPESATGSTDDPAIRQLLAMGIQSPTGPEVQDDSTRILADACAHGPDCDDSRLRGALMTAARYDGNAQLRTKALNGLQPYVAMDMRVRDVVLDSLMHDTSNQVRTAAMDMLSPVEADSSVREVLHNVSTNDQDPQIRSRSRTMSNDARDVGLQIQ